MFWNTSERRTPAMYMQRATSSVHASTSRAVWKMTVACPVVPEEECMRTTSSLGTVRKRVGSPPRKVSLSMNGRRLISSRENTAAGSKPASLNHSR